MNRHGVQPPRDDRPDDSTRRTLALPGPAHWLAGALLAGAALMTGLLLLNSVAYESAIWRTGVAEVAQGTPPMSIDAGFAWLGLHATDIAQVDAPIPRYGTRYSRLWPSYRQCEVVSNEPLTWPGLVLKDQQPRAYRMFLLLGAWKPLYVYRATDPACGSTG